MPQETSWRDVFKQLLYYHTVKVVQIRSVPLGLMYYFILLCVLVYVGVYVIWYNKGYQASYSLVGNTSVKVKGTSYVLNGSQVEVWDAQDVVYPPKEADALFITSAVLPTLMQSRSICTGSSPDETCNNGACTNLTGTTHGITNGVCDKAANYCELYAWCPIEDVHALPTQLQGVQNFTVFVRVTVKFPDLDGIVLTNANGTNTTKGYNLWTVEEMTDLASTSYSSVQSTGAIFAMSCKWECDFDKDSSECIPQFTMIRIDSDSAAQSSGFNFRYAHYYYLHNQQYRDMYKVFGPRFIFLTAGEGRKFSIVPLLVNIGSGLALLTVATLISDVITLFILPDRKFYNKVKYEEVNLPSKEEKSALLALQVEDDERQGSRRKLESSPLLQDTRTF